MNIRSKLMVTALLSLSSAVGITPSFAGVGSSGNAGKGVLCGTSLRTVDLYEAEKNDHLVISNRYWNLESNLSEYGTRLSAYVSSEPVDVLDPATRAAVVASAKKEVVSLFRDIPLGTSLPLSFTNDAGLPFIPSNCSFVQIVVYSDSTHTILRDFTLWNLLSVQDQTALILHAGLQKAARDTNADLSDDAGRIVGMILADVTLPAMNQPVFGKKKLSCVTFDQAHSPLQIGTGIYAVNSSQSGKDGVSLYFPFLNGKFNMGRTTTFIPGLSIESIAAEGFPKAQLVATEDIFDRTWNIEIRPGSTPETIELRTWIQGYSPSAPMSGLCELQQ